MIAPASSHNALTDPPESSRAWRIPSCDPVLEANAAHVWQVDLDAAAPLRRWERHLSADEKARAADMRSACARQRFVVARGLMRELLAFYSQTTVSQLRFGYGAQGKPFLRERVRNPLFFNASHTGSKALFVFASGGEVGVDIERIRDRFEARAGALAMSPPEKRVLRDLDDCARQAAFFKFWTRKEAYVKADGRGLALALHHLDVSPVETAASCSWSRVDVWHEESRAWREDALWNLRTLETYPRHAAAVVTQNRLRQLSCWLWNS